MIILIDAGNTTVKLASVNVNGEIERISIEQFLYSILMVEKVIYASVKNSPELEEIVEKCHKNNIYCQQITTSRVFEKIQCGYEVVENLGVDRWLAIIAARTIYSENNLIIVDAGTAITLDVCQGEQHLGGWIAPGLKLMQESIVEKAPGVFSGSNTKTEIFGTNTPSALFHGCIYSLVGMIEKAEEQLKSIENRRSQPTKIILTGGDAGIISKYLTLTFDVNEDLVFIGIKQFI
jgi:type III pantothenate kinase